MTTCDFCQEKALYDGATKQGPWAYMCEHHFRIFGVGLGSGSGQKLVEPIAKGDPITISAQGIVVKGIVAVAIYWQELGWDIEIEQANVPGGYSRWKQWQDGGRII